MNGKPLIIERIYKAPLNKVWQAITENECMEKWYFNFEEFKAEEGFKFEFNAGSDDKKWLHICEVTEVIEEKKLQYSWRYDGYPGISYVTFELFDMGDQTRLKLTHEGIDSFENDEFLSVANFEQGWNEILGTALKNYLEKL